MLSSKVNVRSIFKAHIKSISTAATGKPDLPDKITFLYIPIVIPSLLVGLCVFLNDTSISVIIGALSIFVGLLFNVLVLIFDMVKRDKIRSNKNTTLHEVLANISFTILISILGIICSALALIEVEWVRIIFNWATYFLLMQFLTVFFMIMKRMYILLDNEMQDLG